eukprot:5057397-Prymnesium_polylepis.1
MQPLRESEDRLNKLGTRLMEQVEVLCSGPAPDAAAPRVSRKQRNSASLSLSGARERAVTVVDGPMAERTITLSGEKLMASSIIHAVFDVIDLVPEGIQHLDCSRCSLNQDGFDALAQRLETQTQLRTIRLSEN